VRAVPLSNPAKNEGKAFEATYENALNGKYPLARNLYIYFNPSPKAGLDPLVRQFLTFVLSKEGQQIVVKDGYYPLPKKLADDQIKTLK
jgi:phosphate transport system substrate-binding protein